uniref:Protein kinase-like domain-containing protein n=1 Tax=Tanacetum cinerariifolium TaxID=118510 RepID=A0A6L2L1T2_TANCI|nr:protein kinase-like domain-containing protein [Tanacetum cinerariifolium]
MSNDSGIIFSIKISRCGEGIPNYMLDSLWAYTTYVMNRPKPNRTITRHNGPKLSPCKAGHDPEGGKTDRRLPVGSFAYKRKSVEQISCREKKAISAYCSNYRGDQQRLKSKAARVLLKGDSSDMAKISRKVPTFNLVRKVQERQSMSKLRQCFWELAGSNLGNNLVLRILQSEESEYPLFEGDDSSSNEWRDYGVTVDDYEVPPVFDDDQYEEEIMIGDVGKRICWQLWICREKGLDGEEDYIKDVVVVANDICSSMIQTTLNVDFEEDINTKSHELMLFRKGILIKVEFPLSWGMELFSAVGSPLGGSIPYTLGLWKSLMEFNAGECKLYGSIPHSIFNLSLLVNFSIAENHLTGSLSSEIGNQLLDLEWLQLWCNELIGILPPSISNCSKLGRLKMGNSFSAENHLTGSLPSEIRNQLLDLEWLQLWGNELTGVLPSSISNCSKLGRLEMGNSFSG